MKRIFILFMILTSLKGLKAQVASTICLDETRKAFAQIDPDQLLKSGSGVSMSYQHTYVMRMDPKQEEKVAQEERTYGMDYYRLDSPDELISGDSKETFTYRKFQNVVYRTRASLEKSGLIPMAKAELFDHCLVRECHFVPAPGRDSISYKRAYMTVDEAGQKQFQIKNMEFITNPHNGGLISIRVNFTDRALFKWSFFEFGEGNRNQKTAPGSAAEEFMGEGGELKENFKGVSLKDYRR